MIVPASVLLKTNNYNQSNYVNEWWGDPSSSYICDDADPIVVTSSNQTNKNFQLDLDGSISGTVTPAEAGIQVDVYSGDPTEEDGLQYITGAATGSDHENLGWFQIKGIPAGSVYVKTNANNYANEWYNDTYVRSEADPVTVNMGVDTLNIDFALSTGGTITGRVLNQSGTPLSFNSVNYWNDSVQEWRKVQTGPLGTFTLSNLAPGLVEMEINPGVTEANTGPVMWGKEILPGAQ